MIWKHQEKEVETLTCFPPRSSALSLLALTWKQMSHALSSSFSPQRLVSRTVLCAYFQPKPYMLFSTCRDCKLCPIYLDTPNCEKGGKQCTFAEKLGHFLTKNKYRKSSISPRSGIRVWMSIGYRLARSTRKSEFVKSLVFNVFCCLYFLHIQAILRPLFSHIVSIKPALSFLLSFRNMIAPIAGACATPALSAFTTRAVICSLIIHERSCRSSTSSMVTTHSSSACDAYACRPCRLRLQTLSQRSRAQ